jgi:uncharacterized delta-60 repeat protein
VGDAGHGGGDPDANAKAGAGNEAPEHGGGGAAGGAETASAGAAGDTSGASGAGGEAGEAIPPFELTVAPVVALRRGNIHAVAVSLTRAAGFEGAVTLVADGLPAAVEMNQSVVSAGASSGTIFFDVLASASVGPTTIRLQAHATDDPSITAEATFELYIKGEPGTIDTSFDDDGVVSHRVTNEDYDYPYDLAVDGEGRVLVAGVGDGAVSSASWVVRLTDDGKLDSSFGDDGRLVEYGAALTSATALMTVGSSTLLGLRRADGLDVTTFVRKVDSQGKVDPSFGTGGDVVIADPAVHDLKPWGDSILVVGEDTLFGLGADGNPKQGFTPPADVRFDRVAVDTQQRVLVAGDTEGGPHTVLRLTASGSLDEAFGVKGVATWPVLEEPTGTTPRTIMAGSQNEVVLLANEGSGGLTQEVALFYFDQDGVGMRRIPIAAEGMGVSAFMQTDGRVVVFYYDGKEVEGYCALRRYFPSGQLDPTFGGDGIVKLTQGCPADIAYDHNLQRLFLLLADSSSGELVLTRLWL